MRESVEEIICDDEIESVHANANFGSISKRGVVNEGVLRAAFGYHSGYVQMSILVEHGLIRKPRIGSHEMTLTKKGKRYLRAAYRFSEISKMTTDQNKSRTKLVSLPKSRESLREAA